MESRRVRIGRALLALAAGVAAASAPVLVTLNTENAIGVDYQIHAWMVAQHGEVWRASHSFPAEYHSLAHAGVPVPIFYGGAMYKVAGVLSAAWGCHVAIRLLAWLSFVAVYAVVRHTARSFGAGEGFAAVAACACCWATYPLTNYYHRAAIPEFFAGAMLACSCCLWVKFLFNPGPAVRWRTALAAGLFLALAASSHPITGLISVPVVGAVYLSHSAAPGARRPGAIGRHAALAAAGLLTCAVLAPWLYAYQSLGSELAISKELCDLSYVDMPIGTAAWVRLMPLPFDYHESTPGVSPLGTRHLDLQISVPLLALAAIALAGSFRAGSGSRFRLALVAAGVGSLAVAAFVLAASPEAYHALPGILERVLGKVQGAYRLVGAVNVALLVLLMLALAFRHAATHGGGSTHWAGPPVALAVVLTVAGCALLQKAMNSRATSDRHCLPTRPDSREYVGWLLTDYCHAGPAYATPDCTPRLTPDEAAGLQLATFTTGIDRDFGRLYPLRVVLPADGFVGTRVVPFRWNGLKVDGVTVPPEQLRLYEDPRLAANKLPATHLAVPVPAGSHTVEFAFTPPRAWRVLKVMSEWVVGIWAVALAAWPVAAWLRRVRGGSALGAPATSYVVRSVVSVLGGRDSRRAVKVDGSVGASDSTEQPQPDRDTKPC